MILYDKTALTKKLGRKIADVIDVLLTPESDEYAVKNAFERLMRMNTLKIAVRNGSEPPEMLIAAAAGLLRTRGDNDGSAGTVAVDSINEALRQDAAIDSDAVFRNDFFYDLIKSGAEQGDFALQAVLADLYVGDLIAPGAGSHLEAEGLDAEGIREAVQRLGRDQLENEEAAKAAKVTGILGSELLEEIDWVPYEDNLFARARKYFQAGRQEEALQHREEAAEAFFRAGCLGNTDGALAYAAATSGIFRNEPKKEQLKALKKFRKAEKKQRSMLRTGDPAESTSGLFTTEELLKHPSAIYRRSMTETHLGHRDEAEKLMREAADAGDVAAQKTAARYYASAEFFDFDLMMRYLLLGISNPGSWYIYGDRPWEPYSDKAAADNAEFYGLALELLGGTCRRRDMIDELQELSEPPSGKTPELTGEQKQVVFMWHLCAPGSDEARQTLARLLSVGFGTAKDEERALGIWKDLCDRYSGAGSQDADGGEAERPGDSWKPYEAFYEYGMHLITTPGPDRDGEKGVELLQLIPADDPFASKAEKMIALTETETSELIRLGNLFRKEGNESAMEKLYLCAEKLGDPSASRMLGRWYSAPENNVQNDKEPNGKEPNGNERKEKALSHYLLGASRGDVQCMFMAGNSFATAGDPAAAFEWYGRAAAAGAGSDDAEIRNIAGRAMKENADLYYSGALTGEKDVPRYLYWLGKAEAAGLKLSDTATDKRRAAENYFKPAQWQELFASAMEMPESDYRDWVIRECAERKITAAQEELGVRMYNEKKAGGFTAVNPGGRTESAYSVLKTPSLSSARARYYTACCLYLGDGCERDPEGAAAMLPDEKEFGDPEELRNEINGIAAYIAAEKLGERHAAEAAELLKKAEKSLRSVYEEQGRSGVLFELSDVLIRAYGIPDEYEAEELRKLWRRGYSYLMAGYGKDPRCTSRVNAFSDARKCEIAALYSEDGENNTDEALKWYLIAAENSPAGQFGAGRIYIERSAARNGDQPAKVTDAEQFGKGLSLVMKAAAADNAGAELYIYNERRLLGVGGDEARLSLKRAAVHGNAEAGELCKELGIDY